jgi:hypothetical protein
VRGEGRTKDNLNDALEHGVDIYKRMFEVKLTTYE